MAKTYPWKCCRFCLSEQFLHQIFTRPEHSEKYTKVIEATTGLKVEINDSLSQEICITCVEFINESFRFQKRCEYAQNTLIKCNSDGIKPEYISNIKTEYKHTEIDITELLPDEDFKDYDDNITLDVINTYENCNETQYNTKSIKTKSRSKKNGTVKTKRTVKKTEKEGEVTQKKEEIECEFCHKILTSKLSLRNHYKIHTGFDVVCEHCGKKFITRRLLLMHCRAKHGYEKTDKCSFCDYKASNAEQVKIHERLHTGERPFSCGQCDAEFHRKSSYLQHIAIHLPEKTVQCSQCPARFKSLTLMRIHLHRHRAPQYTFRCALCEGRFSRRRNAARHLQRVHGTDPTQEHIQRVKLA
ncbi:PREDICTED: zinc finger protein 585B-like [Papilio polytes]|uniref:zinc finger protein 585B-like n=1 Tax=Papilio polytes TaxID=76194 RepID=UPI000675FFDE|nr:PREDICTED: zinc finger protein 585B-like [Papilio polytes]